MASTMAFSNSRVLAICRSVSLTVASSLLLIDLAVILFGPFVVTAILVLILLILFPSLNLWLPTQLG